MVEGEATEEDGVVGGVLDKAEGGGADGFPRVVAGAKAGDGAGVEAGAAEAGVAEGDDKP